MWHYLGSHTFQEVNCQDVIMLLYYNQIRFNLDLVHSCGKDFICRLQLWHQLILARILLLRVALCPNSQLHNILHANLALLGVCYHQLTSHQIKSRHSQFLLYST